MTVEVVAAETIRPGDEVFLPRGESRVVEGVARYETTGLRDEPCVVVSYFATEHWTNENRARDRSGANVKTMLHLLSLKPLAPGDLVAVRRGSPLAASELRGRLEEEQEVRWAEARNRQLRAARFDRQRGRA